MNNTLRALFFLLVVRPVLSIALGASVRHRELLPAKGPAIIVANHNSHLDTLTILAMFPLHMLPKVRPVAAMDYFLKNRVMAWFATNIIGIIPLSRTAEGLRRDLHTHRLEGCTRALDDGDILILFPEGSRGKPEVLAEFKRGVAHLARAKPEVPVHPMFMHGLGKALPKDSILLVPFNCDIVVGAPMTWNGSIEAFMTTLQAHIASLSAEIRMPAWD